MESMCYNISCPPNQPLDCGEKGICNPTNNDSCECENKLLTYPNCIGCGDGMCNNLLENCVNCPADCSPPCNMCGDSQCDLHENCTTCYQDCNCSSLETCIPPCVNGQGTCESGICVCVPPYTGPSCHNVSQPIIIDNKNSTPSVSVQVQGLNSAKFSISLTEMYEKGAGAAIYNRADLSTANYTLVIKNYPSYTFWNYSTILHQVSNVQIYIYYFNYTTSNFEGTNTTIQANTIKMALSISDWPFRDITHSLFVVFSNDISNKTTDSPIEACTRQTSSNHAMNLRWYKISVEGVSLYAQMEEYGILDGRKRAITFTSTNTSQVTIRAPFFWNNLILDPNFGVLLEDDDPCSSRFIDGLRNHKATWQYYLIIPIVAVFVVIGLLFWKFDKIRLWNKFRSPPKLVFEVDQNEDL